MCIVSNPNLQRRKTERKEQGLVLLFGILLLSAKQKKKMMISGGGRRLAKACSTMKNRPLATLPHSMARSICSTPILQDNLKERLAADLENARQDGKLRSPDSYVIDCLNTTSSRIMDSSHCLEVLLCIFGCVHRDIQTGTSDHQCSKRSDQCAGIGDTCS